MESSQKTHSREDIMKGADLDTLACVNQECQLFICTDAGNNVVRILGLR